MEERAFSQRTIYYGEESKQGRFPGEKLNGSYFIIVEEHFYLEAQKERNDYTYFKDEKLWRVFAASSQRGCAHKRPGERTASTLGRVWITILREQGFNGE